MSEHTKTPWKVRQTGIDLQEIYSADGKSIATCWDIDEGVDSEANARHIVHCVNNHERLVEALEEAADSLDVAGEWRAYEKARTLLAKLQADKGGE